MTKDTEEQFFAWICGEYTLPRNDESSQPKGWIQGNTRIGPVLEITTSYLYGKLGVEIRIWSLSEDNTQSWVRISHGSKNIVIDSNNNDTEVPEDYGQSWSSQEWKSGVVEHDRSWKPETTSWDFFLQKVAHHREEHLFGGNAHSARYGELIHDRTGKPVSVHHQDQAYSENFVMGSDAAEFVNKVKDQVRNRRKRMSNVAESGEEHSIIW